MNIHIFIYGTAANVNGYIQEHPDFKIKHNPSWEYPRLVFDFDNLRCSFIVNRIPGKTLWQLIPEHHNWKIICRAIRRLKRFAPAGVEIHTQATLKNQRKALWREVIAEKIEDGNGNVTYNENKSILPLVLAGTNPEHIIDYAPTLTECINDTDPNPQDLGVQE